MYDRDDLRADDFVKFVADATPVAQPRHRIGIVSGSDPESKPRAIAYQAARTHPIHIFKLAVREAAARACGNRPYIVGPVVMDIEIILPRPAAMTRKTKPNPSVLHHKQGDVDNYAKAVIDAMDGIFWTNDCQIAKLYVSKWYASADERPHVRILVGPATGGRTPRQVGTKNEHSHQDCGH